jgi:hypothetical protein
MVGIWSPMYFHSEWCQKECAVMLHRESQLGYGTEEKPDGLIIGVKVNDGIHFPSFAAKSQYADFEPFFFDGPAFSHSPLHVEFQKAIGPLALDVARIAKSVPRWAPDWETAAWIEEVTAKVQMPARPKVAQPLIT